MRLSNSHQSGPPVSVPSATVGENRVINRVEIDDHSTPHETLLPAFVVPKRAYCCGLPRSSAAQSSSASPRPRVVVVTIVVVTTRAGFATATSRTRLATGTSRAGLATGISKTDLATGTSPIGRATGTARLTRGGPCCREGLADLLVVAVAGLLFTGFVIAGAGGSEGTASLMIIADFAAPSAASRSDRNRLSDCSANPEAGSVDGSWATSAAPTVKNGRKATERSVNFFMRAMEAACFVDIS